jgi:hypothetical protein
MANREPLNKEQRQYISALTKHMHFRPRQHECFRTAQMLAIADAQSGNARITYAEGFARLISRDTFRHGWNLIDGQLFDLTLEKAHIDAEYFGLEVPTSEVERLVRKSRSYGSVLEEICRERKSSVHIVSDTRFIPDRHAHMVKEPRPSANDGYFGSLIRRFDEFLEAVEYWKEHEEPVLRAALASGGS